MYTVVCTPTILYEQMRHGANEHRYVGYKVSDTKYYTYTVEK